VRAAWLALALLAPVAQAQTTWGVHMLSAHTGGGFRSVTPGLYFRAADGLTAGVYANSEGGRSAYVGQTWKSGPWALTVGAVTGYRRAKVLPMLAPSYRFASGARLSVIPNPWGSTALHLSWEH